MNEGGFGRDRRGTVYEDVLQEQYMHFSNPEGRLSTKRKKNKQHWHAAARQEKNSCFSWIDLPMKQVQQIRERDMSV